MKKFPGAVTNKELCEKIKATLEPHGYGSNSLVATSLCCDEVNRTLEHDLKQLYRENFSMGGLAGFPFGGATSFGAMAHHIPEGGSCLVVYGPHVGVDSDGNIGKVDRRGRPSASGTCCGSAMDAISYCVETMRKDQKDAAAVAAAVQARNESTIGKLSFRLQRRPSFFSNPQDNDDEPAEEKPQYVLDETYDGQQSFVREALLPHGKRILKAKDPKVELPMALFDCQDRMMRKIVKKMCGEVHDPGVIALLGGIQINTPDGTSDYFLPKTFKLVSNNGKVLKELINVFY